MPKKLPPIPRTMPSILGPIPVEIVANLRDKQDRECFGISRHGERDMRIDRDQHLTKMWATYWHEWFHFVIADAGIELDHDKMEAICDAVGNARTREMLDGFTP